LIVEVVEHAANHVVSDRFCIILRHCKSAPCL
jgi:hypothetical protein